MNGNTLNIDLTEYEEQYIAREIFPDLIEEEFQEAVKVFQPLVGITPDFSGKYLILKAGSNVGVISGNGLRIQVRPRLAAEEFVTLIRYVYSGQVPSKHLRARSTLTWARGFENILALILNDEVNEIFRVGLSRKYVENIESLKVVRGKPAWEKNFPWRGGEADSIVCKYHRLTYDNPDNILLLAGLQKAALLVTNKDIRRKVLKHGVALQQVVSATPVSPVDFLKAEQGYNRLNEHYRVAHNISKLLIQGLRPESFFREGKSEACGIVLNMATLFERFVECFMQDALGRWGFQVRAQNADYAALLDADGKSYASVRPDLEIWRSGEFVGVIDAKYKSYWKSRDEGAAPASKISNADLYQLFFYQQRIQRKYHLPLPPIALIASPLPAENERESSSIIDTRYMRVMWQAGAERAGDVRLVLIPMTDCLRNMNAGEELHCCVDVHKLFEKTRYTESVA